jgi:hypothetical protein
MNSLVAALDVPPELATASTLSLLRRMPCRGGEMALTWLDLPTALAGSGMFAGVRAVPGGHGR